MKIAAIIATVIATLFFLYSSYLLTYDPIAHSSKDGIHMLNFAISYTIPGILWLIYFLRRKK